MLVNHDIELEIFTRMIGCVLERLLLGCRKVLPVNCDSFCPTF